MILKPRHSFGTTIHLAILMIAPLVFNDTQGADRNGGASDWNRYANAEAGLSFRYPKDWVVEDEGFYETAGGSKAEEWSLILFRKGAEDDSNNWIRFNPRQFQETDGYCMLVYSNDVCTYSKDAEVLDALHKIAGTTSVKRPAGPYTPSPSSRERRAILDGLQKEMGGLVEEDILFVVEYLKVNQGWAWVHTSPQSYDGSSSYEDVMGLLQEERAGWAVRHLRPCCGECEEDPDCADDDRYFKKLRATFPVAPPDIFPNSNESATRHGAGSDPTAGGVTADKEIATVNTPGDGFLALRSEPSAQRGSRLAKIPHGTRLALNRCDGAAGEFRWCNTTYKGHKGQSGWVFDRYLLREGGSGDDGILSAVAGVCPQDWCEAIVKKNLGEYASVLFRCKKPNCDNAIGFLKQSNGNWTLVDYGTGITPEDLVSYGFPSDIANQLAD